MCQIFKRPIPYLCLQEIFVVLSLDQPETLHSTGKKTVKLIFDDATLQT